MHINICSLCLFNSHLHHFKNRSFLCFKADEADVVLFVRRLCFMGSLLFQERKSSHPGVKSRDEELSSATPPKPVNPCFKICDLCATEGVNAYKHKQPFLSPTLRVKGTNCELGIGNPMKQK